MLLFLSRDERRCPAGSRASTTSTARRRRACRAVRDALDRTRGGSITRCDGLALDVSLTNVRFPGPREFQSGMRDTRFRCTLDCAWELKATRTTTGAVAATVRGFGRYGRTLVASLQGRRLGSAPVRLSLTVTQAVNPGATATRESGELRPA